jgi:predicted metalloprotease with PDZ domain
MEKIYNKYKESGMTLEEFIKEYYEGNLSIYKVLKRMEKIKEENKMQKEKRKRFQERMKKLEEFNKSLTEDEREEIRGRKELDFKKNEERRRRLGI